MQPGKIRLINTGGPDPAGITQQIAVNVGNRLYRITNDGPSEGQPGNMRIWVTRQVLFWTTVSIFELPTGRSVDVYGSSIKVEALETLTLFGSYDACCAS